MEKRKRNLNPKDHQVLVHQALVVTVQGAIILTVNITIKKMTKLNRNHLKEKL